MVVVVIFPLQWVVHANPRNPTIFVLTLAPAKQICVYIYIYLDRN